jgi:hypothetical protein
MKKIILSLTVTSSLFLTGCSVITGYKDSYSCRSDVGGTCGSLSENLKKSNETNSSLKQVPQKNKDEHKENNKLKPQDNELSIYIAPYLDTNGIWHDESYLKVKTK